MAHLSGDTLLISGDGYGNADGNGGGNGGRKLFAMALIAADARRNKLGNGVQLRRNWLSMCEVRRRRQTQTKTNRRTPFGTRKFITRKTPIFVRVLGD